MSSSRILKDVGHLFHEATSLLPELECIEPEVPVNETSDDPALEEGEIITQNAHEEYESIIQKAQEEAEDILKTARESGYQEGIKQGVQEGLNQGWQQGLEAGKEEGLKQYQQACDTLEKMIANAHHQVKKDWAENESALIGFVEKIVRVVIMKELDAQSEEIVRKALHEIGSIVEEKSDAIIRLSSKDFDVLSEEEVLNGFASVKLIKDPGLDPGDCVVETPSGIAVSSVKKRMDEVVTALGEALKVRKEEIVT